MTGAVGRAQNRPPVPPAPLAAADARDRFGLPLHWTLLTETPAQRTDREAAVRALVCDVFAVAARHFGEDDARKLFRDVSAGRKGAPRKPHNPGRDAELLALYDMGLAGGWNGPRNALPA